MPPSIPSSSLTPPSLSYAICIPVYLLHSSPLSSPVVGDNLSPADVLMSNGCGAFSLTPAANGNPDRLQGVFISQRRPSLYPHANRNSSTAPCSQNPDKVPRETALQPDTPPPSIATKDWTEHRDYVTQNSPSVLSHNSC